jgi:predicted amidohydrolase YtcJ
MSDIALQPTSAPLALAIVNARIRTGDSRRPWADALFLRAGRIEAVGSSAEIRKRLDAATRVIDARGMMVLPLHGDSMLSRGAPADLIVVDRPVDEGLVHATNDAEIVLTIEAGRIVVDRGSLAL